MFKKAFRGFRKTGKEKLIQEYIKGGRVPWSKGYNQYKFQFISNSLGDKPLLENFRNNKMPSDFAKGLDERAVEYPWIFSRMSNEKTKMLDAGSTFNFSEILNSPPLSVKDLTIATFYPEVNKFNERRISYVYADLRELPFRNDWFSEIICQSTIEHIDMDNSIYGYKSDRVSSNRSYAYLSVIDELKRVLSREGKLLLTFPYGKFKNYGFFQQFDEEMVKRLTEKFDGDGKYSISYLKYERDGWTFSSKEDMKEVESHNPHTGEGKGDDGAAHCRGIACIEFIKL